MPGPARAGAMIYAHSLTRLSDFYQRVLTMKRLHASAEHHVIESADLQLIIHALPEAIASTFSISTPPVVREEQSIKLFFTVPSIAAAAEQVRALGGEVFGPFYEGPGFTVRNAYDPEGNVFQLRQNLEAARP